jgi:hypothetical protein
MEPASADGRVDLPVLRLDLLRRAVEIYLTLAYPSGVVPEAVKRRLVWKEGSPGEVLLSGPPFERAGKAPGRPSPIYALRLGNERYPHMKLQIQPWPDDAGFMVSVNTHDQVAGLELNPVDGHAFRALQAENQRLKEAIEQAWDSADLPTFLRYLRDYIKNCGAGSTLDGSEHRPDPAARAPELTPSS